MHCSHKNSRNASISLFLLFMIEATKSPTSVSAERLIATLAMDTDVFYFVFAYINFVAFFNLRLFSSSPAAKSILFPSGPVRVA